jgi:gamma-glutamyltranspeptidase/glutathione hydrolase
MPERGPLSVTTPGALSGWFMLHERYGTVPFGKLLQPAIKLAREGFEINPAISIFIALGSEVIKQYPTTAKVFLDSFDGSPRRQCGAIAVPSGTSAYR